MDSWTKEGVKTDLPDQLDDGHIVRCLSYYCQVVRQIFTLKERERDVRLRSERKLLWWFLLSVSCSLPTFALFERENVFRS